MRARSRQGVVLVLAWAVAGCALEDEPPDILLLVVDTLRADHLGLYGYPRPTSPTLDRLAEDAVVFDPAVAPSPWTLPSVASLLTSSYPSVHGLQARKGPKKSTQLRDGLTTLTEVLQAAGYRTAGVGTNPWVNTEGHGLRRGFERYDDVLDARAVGVNERAREILESGDARPTFLYLHYMDVHGPYLGRRDPFVPDLGEIDRRYRRRLTADEIERRPRYLGFAGNPSLALMIDAYDRSIRSWDYAFGDLMGWLAEEGRLDDTIVAVVSDHGEEFLEHGGWNHGMTLFEEQLRVPWILWAPGQPGRRVEAGAVSLVDVAPTLLSLAGVPVPGSMAGRDALAPDPDAPDRAVFSQTHIAKGARFRAEHGLVAMRRGDRKWMLLPSGERCFDLESDPDELLEHPCDEEGLAATRRWEERAARRAEALGQSREFEISDEQRAQLEGLGYAE